jgi:fatty-acyl-CoA synthase
MIEKNIDQVWLDGLTMGQVLTQVARQRPQREALIFPQQNLRLNYSEYLAAVRTVGKGLLGLGIKPGEHIGVWATNIPQWPLLQWGAASVGIVLVTINPSYRPFELNYTIAQSDLVALFITDQFKSSDYYQIFAEACPDILTAQNVTINSSDFPKLRLAVALKPDAPEGYLPWQQMLAAGENISDAEYDAVAASLKPGQLINIQYTSGTTGFPKAAMLTHRNILMNGWHVTGCQNITEHDRMCVPVPFYHCFGCVMGSIGAVTRGAAMVVPAEYFNASASLQAIEQEKCSILYGVPTMFVALLEAQQIENRNLTSLRSGIMAGSPCPIEIMRRVTSELHCPEITIAYGQTETAPVITQSNVGDDLQLRVETVGQPLPGVQVQIRDPHSEQPLPIGVQGELCARGHGVMLGYYNNPEATAATIDSDGWVRTGDLAIMRDDGYFKITGRLKDMLIRGGENIYPREIEEFLFTHPSIAQAAVFGVPDAKYGEEICAWVQLHAGAAIDCEAIRAFCKANLAHYKVPRYIELVGEFPITVSGKMQKFKMRETMCAKLNLNEINTA